MAKVAVLGYGTVGSGVVHVVDVNKELVAESAGQDVEIKYILDLRDFPGDPHEAQVVHDYDIILNDPEIDVICETMGGLEPAYTFEKKALMKGISVCTSNKELVAAHGPELVAIAKANNCSYLFEASVGGGIPILRTLNTSLRHEKIDQITGILNGTTNYILTKMDKEKAGFAETLKEAQDKGYAERNPEADIEGYDACRKTAILASLVSGEYVSYEDIETTGITAVSQEDFAYARALNMSIKLLGMVKRNDTGFFTMVSPFLLPAEHPLASVNEVFNAIVVHGNMLGNTMYYGKGAGKDATASAVVADMIDLVAHKGQHINVNLTDKPASLSDNGSYVHRFFVRTSDECAEEAREIFGESVEQVTTDEVFGEFAFVTDLISEKDFRDKYEKLSVKKGFLREL
ncbi:homoserine dehydrogenase [Butyrivibrio sp. MC2013]|uniref:homoserine dehydrogenase n=1 Tax=Butyrivibrio sp. MC2013 TaxID=1280686 RepID=UPI0003F7525D|nr:homoserine dehydrogenase [Butyrivibrio sp. MC2013]